MEITVNSMNRTDVCFWEEQIQRFTASDFSLTEFCRRNELSVSEFQLWIDRLDPESSAPPGTRFLEIPPNLMDFSEPEPRPDPPVVLTLGKLTVSIYNQADPQIVEAVLKGMRP